MKKPLQGSVVKALVKTRFVGALGRALLHWPRGQESVQSDTEVSFKSELEGFWRASKDIACGWSSPHVIRAPKLLSSISFGCYKPVSQFENYLCTQISVGLNKQPCLRSWPLPGSLRQLGLQFSFAASRDLIPIFVAQILRSSQEGLSAPRPWKRKSSASQSYIPTISRNYMKDKGSRTVEHMEVPQNSGQALPAIPRWYFIPLSKHFGSY